MQGRITQEFGCTGFSWEPSYGGCRHFHRGIDIANTMYTPIYAAGAGQGHLVRPQPVLDPAWIVIIAHSVEARHVVRPRRRRRSKPVGQGRQYVGKGQIIAYEGMTGNTTGPHLHWAVQLNDNWVNPRLFLPR